MQSELAKIAVRKTKLKSKDSLQAFHQDLTKIPMQHYQIPGSTKKLSLNQTFTNGNGSICFGPSN